MLATLASSHDKLEVIERVEEVALGESVGVSRPCEPQIRNNTTPSVAANRSQA